MDVNTKFIIWQLHSATLGTTEYCILKYDSYAYFLSIRQYFTCIKNPYDKKEFCPSFKLTTQKIYI